MQKMEFYRILSEAIEIQNVELNESTRLKEIEGYDSMSVLAIIALVDEHFSKRLTAKQLNEISTVKSLMELIGEEHFSEG
jgi:acyl carrier protein